MNRRDFLKTSGALGMGAIIPFSSPKGEEKDKMIHWGKKTLACGTAPYTPYIQSNQIDNIQWKCVSDVAIHKADKLDPPAFLGTFKKDARWNTMAWNDHKRFKRCFISPQAAEEWELPFWGSADITQTRTPALRIEYDDNKVKKSESIIYYESPVHFQSNYYDSCFTRCSRSPTEFNSLGSFKDMPTFDWSYIDATDDVMGKAEGFNSRFECLWQFFIKEIKKRGKWHNLYIHPNLTNYFQGWGYLPLPYGWYKNETDYTIRLNGWRQYNDDRIGLWENKQLKDYPCGELIFVCEKGKFRVNVLWE